MWSCDACGAQGEDHFQVCWQCGAPRAGVRLEKAEEPEGPAGDPPVGATPWLTAIQPAEDARELRGAADEKSCVACGAAMDPRGEVPIRVDGPDGWTFFRGLDELNERLWRVEVWACTGCRRLELYESG